MQYHPENDPQHIGLKVNEGVSDMPMVNPYMRPKRIRRTYTADEYVEAILQGDITMLSRAVTLVESALPADQKMAQAVIEKCLPHAGKSIRLGITGVPGAGKSTFIDEIGTLLTGKLSEEEWTKLAMASAALSQTDLRVDDNPSITVAEINAKCRRLDNLGLVVIDYLQLMQGSGYGKASDNRVNVVSDISRSLKIMAKELNVPVICLSQLSRGPEGRTDKRPMLSDLRESGAIEQDADEVIFLYRDEYYNENTEDKGVAECIVAKNRHGEVGTVKLQWIGQYQTFADREWKHAE